MAKQLEIYECQTCKLVVEVLRGGQGDPYCCNEPMQKLEARSEDAGREKHVPVVERTATGVKVKVGDVPHPMLDNHFIEWIEIRFDDKVGRKYLKAGEAPEAQFDGVPEGPVTVREHCNVHGLWKATGG